jgi:SERRATE/Ars2, N-terminal domain
MATDEFGRHRHVPAASTATLSAMNPSSSGAVSSFANLGSNVNYPYRTNDVAAIVRQRGSRSPSPPTSFPQHGQFHSQNNNNSGNNRYGGRGRGGGYHHNYNQNRNYRADRDSGRNNHFLSAPVSALVPSPGTRHHADGNTAVSSTSSQQQPGIDQQQHHMHHSKLPENYQQYRLHPSFAYVDQPLLCGYVWKSSESAQKLVVSAESSDEIRPGREIDDVKKEEDDNKTEDISGEKSDHDTAKSENNPQLSKFYDEYKKRYCLNYVRSFFNVHMDDCWFRQRFSPLIRMVTIHQTEQQRAFAEARAFAAPFSSSDVTSIETFLNDVRLGNGIKQQIQSTGPTSNFSPRRHTSNIPAPVDTGSGSANVPPVQQLFSFQQKIPQDENDSAHQPDDDNNVQKQNRKSELFGLHVIEIPPHVTDEHIALALVDQYNTTATAKHELKKEEMQKSLNKADAASPNTGIDNSKDASSKAGNPVNLTVPKKGANKPVVSLPPPTLLKLNEVKVYTAPATLLYDGPSSVFMHRQVFVTGPASAFIDIIVTLKQKQDAILLERSNDASTPSGSTAAKRSVPRKGIQGEQTIQSHPEAFYGPFDLTVDCSDPYGRVEYDADGRGGAPADGLTVIPRRATVGLCPVYTYIAPTTEATTSQVVDLATANLRKQQQHPIQQQGQNASNQQHPFATPVVVLSAALSSKTRIEQDLLSAKTIAKALDTKKRIPRQFRLQNILSDQQIEEASADDQLDVAIAYLRRVHLMSFYTGCADAAETIGDSLALKHPSGTIHLRLQNADEYIQNAANASSSTLDNGNNNDEAPVHDEDINVEDTQEEGDSEVKSANVAKTDSDEIKKDLLVQRLDDSIAKTLESLQTWLGDDYEDDIDESTVPGLIDPIVERDSKEIEALEQHAQAKWVDDHFIDDEGRARCGFQFCHKLFKDKSFLEKHLVKKHSEYLRAEQAKCHDRYMMSEWEACTFRPVPSILVDCGNRIGCVPTKIIPGQAEPDVVDPEPELWKVHQEQQRREMEMKQKREELRQQQYNNNTFHHKGGGVSESPRNQQDSNKRNFNTFVDVDDMKEEKVELSFDAIETDASAILAAANKKKKKKKKLL